MNGKGQFLMNLGITGMFGLYGIVGAFFNEITRPEHERSGRTIAYVLTFGLIWLTVTICVLAAAYSELKRNNRALHDE